MWKEICQSCTYCQSGKKSLAEQNLFDEKLAFGEDEEWNLRLLSNPIRAGIVKKLWYYYIQRKNSTLHRFRNDFIKSMKSVCLLCGSMLGTIKRNRVT